MPPFGKLWVLAVCLAVCALAAGRGYLLSAGHGPEGEFSIPERYQVREEETGAVSQYMLNITDGAAIGLAAVDSWLTECDPMGEGFQWLVYSDPDSWDGFFYLPRLRTLAGDLRNQDVTISLEEESSGRVLCIYLHTRQDMTREKTAEEQLLHFAAPLRGVWPNKARVYLDGQELPCDGMTIYD